MQSFCTLANSPALSFFLAIPSIDFAEVVDVPEQNV
jgi:hypothetical protein